jgi:drug/metabolite transporter (DMT)-like permease
VVAPTSAVIGAAIPVLFGGLFEGLPGATQFLGFLAGLVGIWLITGSASDAGSEDRRGLRMAVIAGVGFGAYFVLMGQVEGVLAPVMVTKVVSLLLGAAVVMVKREGLPAVRGLPVAILAGVLDAGGSVFYLLAGHATRLDVAAVLSSMYPAVTVMLSAVVLKERISARQWGGVALCVVAISLIAL